MDTPPYIIKPVPSRPQQNGHHQRSLFSGAVDAMKRMHQSGVVQCRDGACVLQAGRYMMPNEQKTVVCRGVVRAVVCNEAHAQVGRGAVPGACVLRAGHHAEHGAPLLHPPVCQLPGQVPPLLPLRSHARR